MLFLLSGLTLCLFHLALAFFHDQLEATAFREEYDPDSFEDLTLPPVKQIHKVRGARRYILVVVLTGNLVLLIPFFSLLAGRGVAEKMEGGAQPR